MLCLLACRQGGRLCQWHHVLCVSACRAVVFTWVAMCLLCRQGGRLCRWHRVCCVFQPAELLFLLELLCVYSVDRVADFVNDTMCCLSVTPCAVCQWHHVLFVSDTVCCSSLLCCIFQPVDKVANLSVTPCAAGFQPLDKVAEYVKDMYAKELNKDDLSTVAQLAYLESQPGTKSCLSVFSVTYWTLSILFLDFRHSLHILACWSLSFL